MQPCCEADRAAKLICPSCHREGHPVSRATVSALVRSEVDAARLAACDFRFCQTPTCSVVYYSGNHSRIERDEVRVAVHQKDEASDVPLCYCFGVSKARLVREREAVVAFVNAEVKAGRCACDVKNPSGRCCLGDLRRFLRAIQKCPSRLARPG